jgi:hypothetical protein
MARLIAITSMVLLSACGSHAPAPAQSPQSAPAAPAAVEPPPAEPPPRFTEIPPPPATCSELIAAPGSAEACPDRAAVLEALAEALEAREGQARDAGLAGLEGCASLETGIIRALRADLAPDGCADVLTDTAVGEDTRLRREVRDALVGLGIAAKLSRVVRSAPALEPPYDRARFMEFFQSELVPWISGQARAIFELSTEGAKLRGYGQGVVAVEAGLAEMRFVELARGIPLPEDMAQDAEVREAYFAALDEALEPRKIRGRDAALVGLRRLSEIGVLGDPRVDRTRALLSELFGGRRIDALDGLLLPPAKDPAPKTVEHRLLRQLPTFYVGYLVPDADVSSPEGLAALVDRGLPPAMLERLRRAPLGAESTKLLARGFIRLGQRYWRAEDFRAAVSTLAPLTSGRQRDEEARLLSALSEVLAAGPRDAAEMMLQGPRYPAGVGNVEPLDRVAQAGGAHAGLAAFDAAYVLRLVPPLEGDPEYFDDIARRFRAAARRLDSAARAVAEEHARAAEETARAVRASPTTP